MREKDELTAERDAQIAQIAVLRAEIGTHLAAIRQRESERASAGGEIQALKEDILMSKVCSTPRERPVLRCEPSLWSVFSFLAGRAGA